MERLRAVMARLRAPDGCPWDREQDFSSIAPFTIEEAYEVDEAIRLGDRQALKDELGDLLFQVIFHARMAEEEGVFDLDDVAEGMTEKLIRRHPHVFGDGHYDSEEAQTAGWEAIKAAERAEKGEHSALDDVPLALPALARATKLGKRASRVGFDWPDRSGPLDKVREELDELQEAMDEDQGRARLEAELGDLLFAVTNVARHLKLDPEKALRQCNAKFERRFRAVESGLKAEGRNTAGASLADMDALWDAAKLKETGND
ncbi:MazG family protein [Natronospira proteinivora]|uniref:MazG family protein n=1 Tax=Natronospira proteinivora TaxID=1807133 RepID=A0ABT1G668_9GAMM|nr:nucleoside triphosphate pyrophosphohydrolase [Natronospira proteinivora]MCP1726797.1 MazG family protein [Natronospira proteinivora]